MSISLTAQMTTNLLSLQGTAKLMGITQDRLATGKKVNSAIDDPVAFFDADAHYQLASDYAALKNGMSEAIQTIKAATDTIESIKSILQQMKSIATSAKSSTAEADSTALEDQYDALRTQLDNLAGDAIYKGVNLLADANTLSVVFNVEGDSLDVVGDAADCTGLAVTAATDWWDSTATPPGPGNTNIDTDIALIDAAITTLRSQAKTLASNLSVVTTRQDFTDKMIATLKIGGDNLTLADMNEEGANMLMLQTRQALGIQSLSMASQSAQQVLSLFR
jgi:flagellin-like hook-associated protein FlgL